MIGFARVSIGSGGLPHCSRCAAPTEASFSPEATIAEEIASACDTWASGPGPNVAFVGAEAFLHPSLPGLIARAADAGAERILLETSGAALAVGDNAAGALSSGVTHIEIWVLGDEAPHDALRDHPGAWKNALAGVARFEKGADAAGATVSVSARIPVCRHNFEGLANAVGSLAARGIRLVTLDVSAPAAASIGCAASLDSALSTGIVNGTWVTLEGSIPDGLDVDPLHFRLVISPAQAS